MATIFISHSSSDNALAADMKAWLEAGGHTSLFLDFDPDAGIKGGTGWEQTLYQKLRQCQVVIVLLTPGWLASKWCFAELVLARERGKAIFPVKVRPCDAVGVLSDIQHIDLIAQQASGYERLRIGLLERGLDPLDVFDWDPKRSPYPGLLAFQEQDAAIFFGRGDDILKTLETLEALRRQDSGVARLALLLGASGSGKSSLVRAGIIPRLKKKSADWLPVPPLRPQVEPLDELALSLAAAFDAHGHPREWSAIRTELHTAAAQTPVDGPALLDLVRDLAIAARQPEATVLLTIDQTEELLGYAPADAAARFLRLLRSALEIGGRRLMVVATLRSDFLGEFQNHPVLQDGEYLHHFRYRAVPIDPMPLRSFSEVIRGPARLAGLELEDGLVEAMVGDTGTRDALPLLAFTLRRLYERFADDGRLTMAEYESVGRLDGAVREEAERIITEANPTQDDMDALHAAFVPTMVRINAEGAYARRRALLGSLPHRVLALIRRFIDARLLVTDCDQQGRETSEVAHEALLRTWPQLSDWLLEDRDKLRLLESLQRAAEEWDQADRRGDLLVHRDGRLKEAESLAQDSRFAMPETTVEGAYLRACSASQRARDAAAKDEQERRIRDAEQIAEEQKNAAEAQKRIAEKQKTIARGVLIGSCTMLLLLGLASWQWREASFANRKVGEVQQLARLTGDIGTPQKHALLLSVQSAFSSKDGREGSLIAIDALRQQLRTAGGRPLHQTEMPTRVAAFSRDRRWLATGSDEGAVRLWDLNDVDSGRQAIALDGHKGPVHGLAFSPDGRWLVSSAADGSVRLWRLTVEGAKPDRVFDEVQYGAIQSLAISPDGAWLVFGTQSGNVCIWKMTVDGPQESSCEAWQDDFPVMQVIFSPAGQWLATSCTGACKTNGAPVRLWHVSADFPQREPRHLSHKADLVEDSLLAMAFNADETRLAIAYGYSAVVWDLTQDDPQHEIGQYPSDGGWIKAVGLSPDNRWLAIGSGSSSNVLLWDLADTRKEAVILRGHSSTVNTVVFSDDGRWLATGSDDATARLWDMADPTIPGVLLRGQELPVKKVVFSPGSAPHHLVTVGDEPSARLFTIPDPLIDPIVLRGSANPVIIGMAVSPDGNWIATSSANDEKLVLWSTVEPRQPQHELSIPSPSHAIAFSPDGRWLAAKSQDKGVISLWTLADLSAPPRSLAENEWGDGRTLLFSPDNRWLVSGTGGGDVNIWDVSDGSPSLEPHYRCNQGEGVREPAFSADGRYLATAAQGRSARLWDLSSPDPCANPRVLPHANVVYQVVFSPDSRWGATASFDGKGRLWDLGTESEPKLIAETTFKNRVLQAAFSPDGRWVAFGSWDQSIRLIDLSNPTTSNPIELFGHRGRITSVSFSPDGTWLVTASEDRTIRLWDPLDPAAAPVVLRGHEASVQHVGFSKDGGWMISGAFDGTVRLWRLKLSDLIAAACQTAGRNLTPEETLTFLGNENARQPCNPETVSSH